MVQIFHKRFNSLAKISVAEADYDQARELLEEAIQLWSVQTPESTHMVACHESLGEVLRLQGDFEMHSKRSLCRLYRSTPGRAPVAGRARGNGGLGRRSSASAARTAVLRSDQSSRASHFLCTPTDRLPSPSSPDGARVP